MEASKKEILKFYDKWLDCHVASVNYFAGILGYHFPKHDSDKRMEPYRSKYAHLFYIRFHFPNLRLSQKEHEELLAARTKHHKLQPHHIEHYQQVSNIPDDSLIEMICDWHSANFADLNILRDDRKYSSPADFFKQKMSGLPWTPHQRKVIKNSIETLAHKADYDAVQKIWNPLNR